MGKLQVVNFKGATEKEIAHAILHLAEPMLKGCGGDLTLQEQCIGLAISGWNLSLYAAQKGDYTAAIEKGLPASLSAEQRIVFISFLQNFIKEKQHRYPAILKGVTSHKLRFHENRPELTVYTLPVNPA